ncbi:MAG: class I SAM-dependent methyltransferase [Anaerolineales bacterium]|nr:class I SAM-dependent methyltransferase [Anaerolineales bacterium]MCX7753653.1 class I SAM-dependent methyltransferase [Anaerolineales bacterium]MDW8279158.1 class I SAM-dependent methyltransferase [Anaerolineales bacterium]
MTASPPICDYEGSDYQTSFWERGGRAYEDQAEAIALRRLLPARGNLLLELGAGAGRNTPRYTGYERIVLLDYSRTQLQQARARLGDSPRYVYVAADIYKLPFRDSLFDGATMIRTLHHMADAPQALRQVRRVLAPGAVFLLEFANKRNLKAILRYWLKKQAWNPFSLEPVEFVALNFDFHPQAIRQWLTELGFHLEKTLTVSHFRLGLLKRLLPASMLAALDGLFQPTGNFFQLTPSVFVRAKVQQKGIFSIPKNVLEWFRCPECATYPLQAHADHLLCPTCGRKWSAQNGIYDFREPLNGG